MDDVYLEGATPDGPAMVGHLSVIVDTAGITFLGPDPGERRTVGWERTSPLEFGAPAALPDGAQATSLEFVVDGRPLRLLVPSKKGPHGVDEDVAPGAAPPVDDAPVADPPVDVAPAVPVSTIHMAEPLIPVVAEPPVVAPPIVVAPPVVVAEAPVDVAAVDVAPAVPVSTIHMAEPLIPVAEEPPAPVLAGPAAPVSAVPPAPVHLVPPAPVAVATPAPDGPSPVASVEPPSPVGVIQDTFVGVETQTRNDTTDDATPMRLPAWFKYVSRRPKQARKPVASRKQNLVRLVLFTVLAGLIPFAAGIRYFQMQSTSGHIVGVPLSDSAIAGRVGIQAGDLPGWSAGTPNPGNVFAAGATSHGAAALATAEQASTVLAGCLHVPVSAVDGAFGMGDGVAQLSAEALSPSYADPAGNGGMVSSVADVVKSTKAEDADASVFQDPALFATCYQPFVQAMLPYSPVSGGAGFATATVQPLVVPVPAGPSTETVAGFQIARIANDKGQTKTVISTATAVFDGRVQVTMGTVSNLVFSIDAQNQLVRNIEIRTIGVSQL